VLDSKAVTSSSTSTVTASATTDAAPGVYSLTVNRLAQVHQVASQGFSDPNSTITVNGTNNTLQGLANAINASGGDVSATIVNTGAATNPYELLLASKKSGAANAITITNNLAADNGGAVKPLLTTTGQAAADASVTLGSGAGALTVSSPTNVVNGLISGVTLNLVAANSTTPVTLTVANDTTAATKAVQAFVDAYNTFTDLHSAAWMLG
jgi:flagellar hook-associated protein 2